MRFQLVRYFAVASLTVFALVGVVLWYLQSQETAFFKGVQGDQLQYFKKVQEGFAKQQEDAARRDLLAVHEAGSVNVTRLFANALWERDFSPFVARASKVSAQHCRAIADVPDAKDPKKMVTPPEKKSCFSEVGKQIQAIAGFKEIDAKVFDSMKKSSVFKIKVYDLGGITVYSSDHKQIGEDKAGNAGWQRAAKGTPASQLSHRDSFGAFEGTVTNRDLIESYIPVMAPGTDKIVAVFEVYSDVTRFLEQIAKSAADTRASAAASQKQVEQAAADNQAKIESASNRTLAIVIGMLLITFGALFAIVRRADAIIVAQADDREQAQHQLAQSEKMASLGQMVAGVAHQLNTPLAFSHSNVSMVMERLRDFALPLKVANQFAGIVRKSGDERLLLDVRRAKPVVSKIDVSESDVEPLSQMLGDTLQGLDQMRELVENLLDFTRLDRAKVDRVSVNRGLQTVVYIAKSVMPTTVRVVEEYGELPMIECNPSQLNQVFLNLVTNAAQSIQDEGTVTVRTLVDGNRVRIDVSDTGSGIAPDVLPHIFENYYTTKPAGEGTGLGLPMAKTIVEQHGGEIAVNTEVGVGSTFSVYLPLGAEVQLKQAA